MKKLALLVVMVIGVCTLSGCKRIELDDATEEAYVEYAVNAVINHDKNNMLKLERVVIENETKAEWIPDSSVSSDDGNDGNDGNSSDVIINTGDTVSTETNYVSFEEALGNNSLSVKVKGIKECSSYPDEGENLAFVLTASSGSRLVVVEMALTNISDKTVEFDATENFAFKGIFNGVVRTNALGTGGLFNYTLNDNVHSIAAGETKDVVLVYEVNSEKIEKIEKIVISVTRDDNKYSVSVK